MNYVYTKQQLINMEKASRSTKKSKGYTVTEFLKLTRQWTEEAKVGNMR